MRSSSVMSPPSGGVPAAGGPRVAGRDARDAEQRSSRARARWYPPLVVLATSSIVVLPAVLAALLVPPGGWAAAAIAAGLAVVLSLALASVEAWLWQRWQGSRDVLFSDLTLWGCARRWWAERRLRDVRRSYEAAVEAGTPVRLELLEGLSRLLAARSAYTYGHCRRVARHAEGIARTMRLPEAEVARIRTAAAVHDVGKVYTPQAILDKPGPLTEEELAVVQQHSADGADMLRSVRDPQLAAIVRHHHERLDGSGYPDGLVGEQIPLGARIVAVADTFDAVTSARPYRGAHHHREGLAILAAQAGTQLDGQAVAAFLERYSARRSVAPWAFLTAVSARAVAGLGLASGGLGAAGASLGQLAPTLGTAGLLALVPAGGHLHGASRRASAPAPVRAQQSPAAAAFRTRSGTPPHATVRSPAHRRAGPQQAPRAPLALLPADRGGRTPHAVAHSPATSHAGGQPTGSPPPTASSPPSSTASSAPASSPAAPPTTGPPAATPPAAPSAPPATPPAAAPAAPASPPVTVQTGSTPSVTVTTPVGGVSVSVTPPSVDVGHLLAIHSAAPLTESP